MRTLLRILRPTPAADPTGPRATRTDAEMHRIGKAKPTLQGTATLWDEAQPNYSSIYRSSTSEKTAKYKY
jgi:hypothetical protein